MAAQVRKKAVKKPVKKSAKQAVSKKASKVIKSEAATFIVGIGASAGGIEALQQFVNHLPLDSTMAYVVAQHMSSQHRSMMVELLARQTELSVVAVENNVKPVANVIYITPPNNDVYFQSGRLRLRKPQATIGPKPSVDYLLTSLASELEDQAIGVIFSGTGSDGSHGMRAIKAAGGITIAQNPASAKYDSMPQSAIRAGAADLVLNPDETARQLPVIVSMPRQALSESQIASADTFQQILERLYQKHRISFFDYKEATLQRQLERRLTALQLENLEAYLAHIERDATELDYLLQRFLISVTRFFRDRDHFLALRGILSNIVKQSSDNQRIRIWVPGCASGEEPYSIAVLLAEELGRALAHYDVKIFATDIDVEATDYARRGLYPETALDDVDPELIKKYFDVQGRSYQIKKSLREMVVFARHDVIQDPPFLQLDLVSCRNLLIYFKTELQNKIMAIFHYALDEGGYLFLGKSESVGRRNELFATIDSKHRLFRRKSTATPRYSLPRLSSLKPVLPTTAGSAELKPHQPSFDGFARRLLDAYTPATVLVDRDGNCLHYFHDLTAYLTAPAGAPSNQLPLIVLPELRSSVRALLHRTKNSNAVASGHFQAVAGLDDNAQIRVVVRPAGADSNGEETFFVSFERQTVAPTEQPKTLPPSGQKAKSDSNGNGRGRAPQTEALRQELHQTREHLQTVIEEMESSNEELQSLNEELQASTEELQSSNEELETTNEELQASNEELSTVNEELQIKSSELGELNATLENIQDSIDVALIVVDDRLRLVRYTAKALRVFGILTTDVGRPITELPSHLGLRYLKRKLNKVLKTEAVHQEDIAGDKAAYSLQITPYRDGFGHVTGAVLAFADITSLHQALQDNQRLNTKLETSLALRQTLLDTMPVAVIGLAPDASIRFMNNSAQTLLGYSTGEVIGQVGVNMASWHDSAELHDYLAQFSKKWRVSLSSLEDFLREMARRGNVREEHEWCYRRKNGSRFPGLATMITLFDERGEPDGFLKIIHDLSAQRAAEAELLASEARFREIYQKTPVMLHTIDEQGRLTEVSSYWLEKLGYRREEVIGHQSIEFLTEESRRYATDKVLPVFWRDGSCSHVPYQMVKKNGDIFDVELSAVMLRNNKGERYSLAMMSDVSTRTRVEQTLQRRNDDLDGFVRIASHDLREPLRKITMFGELLEHNLNAEATTADSASLTQDYLGQMIDAARRLRQLVDDLLQFVRSGKMRIRAEPLPLDDCVDEALGALALQLREQPVQLQRDPLPRVQGDRTMLTQLYQNLISNALKYNNRNNGKTQLWLTAERAEDSDTTWVLGVRDNGIGIAAKHREQIFEPFRRLHNDAEYDGTGIGLAICAKIVAAHGGAIWVESEPGEGAHFKFTLPVVGQGQEDAQDQAADGTAR